MPKIRVSREEFLARLHAIEPGLSSKEILEQSSSVVFQDGWLISYNDEISCRYASKLGKEFAGAVKAKPLIELISKLPDDEIELEATDSELLITGKKRRAGVVMQKDVQLQVASVDKPGTWKKLPDNFDEAISIVSQCAGRDQSNFKMTCVHLHPKFVEACDEYQLARYNLDTGIQQEALVRCESIKHVLQFGMTEFSETDSWLHFRNPSKLILSCRRFVEEYPDLAPIMKIDNAHPAALPKGLVESADLAGIFSKESTDDNDYVLIKLRPGCMWIRGQGASGWFEEPRKIKYDGGPLNFLITPKLLVEIVTRHNECQISKERLKVVGNSFVYMAYLAQPEEGTAVEDGLEEEPVLVGGGTENEVDNESDDS